MVETGFTYYWSRRPGEFVNKRTGQVFNYAANLGPTFTGTISEWYETLVETAVDVLNTLAATKMPAKITVGPEVACILECTVSFRPVLNGGLGPEPYQVGTLNNRFDVWVDCESEVDLLTVEAGDAKGFVRVLHMVG